MRNCCHISCSYIIYIHLLTNIAFLTLSLSLTHLHAINAITKILATNEGFIRYIKYSSRKGLPIVWQLVSMINEGEEMLER